MQTPRTSILSPMSVREGSFSTWSRQVSRVPLEDLLKWIQLASFDGHCEVCTG